MVTACALRGGVGVLVEIPPLPHFPFPHFPLCTQFQRVPAYHQSQPRVSPDEKVFTTRDERGFLPYTPHPTPYTLFQVSFLKDFLNKPINRP
ncbi:MAG: hypothetical protein EWV64_06895 [Microcystis flos-aquae Ma_QC_C_20070823_S18]|uniref:Uncharacterized protein n=1 Tax=Microcystis flos-aquae Mf_QC_C_20070823_S10D TaxID=2486236 RepID=A0A552L765_9CHRO|nr:MAG: hypothetical protein EWV64_06895 [Microcystis flos-aquae Ma_QC_C_20070823_S18]TRT91703.1 MAG: hypothetical protein EWV65_21930 [Microcystis flos-aquae Ma_QC_C_20070823_S18D]TRV16075.1 MAG: hypothetical protein EWV45_01075 [Microcystis flos-aquae Mf_QC_C_20070823_S10D]TRV22522.1 MAG: hypothetical protein EWV72_15225 [Microcystis flos-aquae Mf_QC_C_20070823_S10]TRV31517.1 MAG: hypothetical protein EWV70_17025 [Microcystis flos-aquae Mf_QC_C_20070823_S20]TRV35693.1 MAG: hypothetical prote